MKKRREAQSAALSFMDCICCGFGAVLLLFILPAKKQITDSQQEADQSFQAAETLQTAIRETEAREQALDKEIEALDPRTNTNATSLSELAAQQERLAKEIEAQSAAPAALETPPTPEEAPAALERPSADQNYLSGLRLRGPRAVILLESSGSMLATDAKAALEQIQQGNRRSSQKWDRAKAAVRAVLAAIPKGTEVAVFSMAESTEALTGSPRAPYIDPYDNAALLSFLERLDALEAGGGADLSEGLATVRQLNERASSLLLIGDGLPTAPAPRTGGLSEADRVSLFKRALSSGTNFPVNTILFPFEGDPSAAGLFWQLSSRTNGITLMPDNDWPSI